MEEIQLKNNPGLSKQAVYKSISKGDEWLFQAHSETDYSELTTSAFENTVKEYSIFLAKKHMDLIDEDLDELELLELFRSQQLKDDSISSQEISLNQRISKESRLVEVGNLPGLFSVRGTKNRRIKTNITPGNYHFVTTSNKNNGVASTSKVFEEKGNVITVDSATEGKAFYQEFEFVGSDHVEVLKPIGFQLNRLRAMFIVTMLNFNAFRYGYGRKRSQERMKTEKILLPINSTSSNELVDWQFAEDFIKSLPYSSNLDRT